jgi:hypothetical protein
LPENTEPSVYLLGSLFDPCQGLHPAMHYFGPAIGPPDISIKENLEVWMM